MVGQPQWDIIVDGCENHMETHMTTFHPVLTRDVKNPSSLKRFEVKTLASNNSDGLQGLVYFHCNVAVCDLSNPGSPCGRRCAPVKRGGSTIIHSAQELHSAVSSGPIRILTPEMIQSPDRKETNDGTHRKFPWIVLLAIGAAV
ncbi:zona pellucida domain-containing protein, partial [Salmonella enterica subsp. enterica serovar 1,4,[5],12:i:-]|nr:zona pellucida domain-containing protein [Salmonella enterica subsp. enterica serovar 1,4,[5],12:i:-]